MAWEAIKHITGPLTFGAFVILVVFTSLWQFFRHRENINGFIELLGKRLNKGELFRLLSRLMMILAALTFFVFISALIAYIYVETRPGELRIVDVTLKHGESVVPKDFILNYTLPGSARLTIEGRSGSGAITRVPHAQNYINVLDLSLPGFKLLRGGKTKILENEVILQVEPILLRPDDEFPEVPNSYLPEEDELRLEIVSPRKVIFVISNETGEAIELCLYRVPAIDKHAHWIRIQNFLQPFDQFSGGDGWFVVFLHFEANRFQCLGTVNLFVHEEPKLTIKKTNERYWGVFSNVTRSRNSCPADSH